MRGRAGGRGFSVANGRISETFHGVVGKPPAATMWTLGERRNGELWIGDDASCGDHVDVGGT